MAINKISTSFINGIGAWTPIKTALLKINELIDNANSGGGNTEIFENITVTDTATIQNIAAVAVASDDVLTDTCSITNSLTVSTINEFVNDSGVTIVGLKIKEGGLEAVLSTVTQDTSITTSVATSGHFGIITTVSSTLAAGAYTQFTMNNSLIGTDSYVRVTIAEYAGQGIPVVSVQTLLSKQSIIKIGNTHPTEALNNVLKIGFEVITALQ
jgi:hypothetical protein